MSADVPTYFIAVVSCERERQAAQTIAIPYEAAGVRPFRIIEVPPGERGRKAALTAVCHCAGLINRTTTAPAFRVIAIGPGLGRRGEGPRPLDDSSPNGMVSLYSWDDLFHLVDKGRGDPVYRFIANSLKAFSPPEEGRKAGTVVLVQPHTTSAEEEAELLSSSRVLPLPGDRSYRLLAVDCEYATCEKNPGMETIWSPRSQLLSVSLSYMQEENLTIHSRVYDVRTREGLAFFCRVFDRLRIYERLAFVGHHVKVDDQAIYRATGRRLRDLGEVFCTMGLEFCMNTNPTLKNMGGTGLGLKPLSERHLEADISAAQEIEELAEKIKLEIAEDKAHTKKANTLRKKEGLPPLPMPDEFHYGMLPPGLLDHYCGVDTQLAFRLFSNQLGRVRHIDRSEGTPGFLLWEYYYYIYTPMVQDATEVERVGLKLNAKKMDVVEEFCQKEIDRLQGALEAHPLVDSLPVKCNVKSSKWVSALIEATGVQHLTERTATGWKADKVALKKFVGPKDHAARTPEQQIWAYVATVRKYRDVISKNIKNSRPYILPDGRIRPTYHVAKTEDGGTKTSRITTKLPSTNTWTKHPAFLKCLDAPAGMSMVKADWKSIEPMWHGVFAHEDEWIQSFLTYRKDPTDLKADLYRQFYAPLVSLPLHEVSGKIRDEAKVFLLAILYDRHYLSVAEALNISEEEAYDLCKTFWERYPGILLRSNRIKLQYLQGNPLRNVFGQRVYYPTRGRYAQGDLDLVRDRLLGTPLYDWGKLPWVGTNLDPRDIGDARKVGNWEIQSSGWTTTTSMFGVFRDLLLGYDPKAQVCETIHDAYRAYVSTDRLEAVLMVLANPEGPMWDLSKGRMGRVSTESQDRFEKYTRMRLSEVPLCLSVEYGEDAASLREYTLGEKVELHVR